MLFNWIYENVPLGQVLSGLLSPDDISKIGHDMLKELTLSSLREHEEVYKLVLEAIYHKLIV